MTISFRYAAASDVGLIRKSNQDAGYASTNLLVLADGMGGAAGGDVASSIAVAHLAQIDDVHQAEDLLPLLTDTLEAAHAELIQCAQDRPALAGLGTTCIAILRASNKLGMVHVGDSRAYLLRGDSFTQITHDHTLVQYLVDTGELTPEEAENHPKRNVIMRNIGDSPEPLEIDKSLREAIPGDRWLLCSDGLFGVVSKERIAKTLLDFSDLDACAQRLVDLALAAGAPDNVTVVVADVASNDAVSPAPPVIVGSAAIDAQKPTRGSDSAAGKMAALRRREPDAEEVEERRGPSPWARVAAIGALIALVGGGGFASYAWSQTQYFVAESAGKIAIFKGVPQDVGPLKLSSLYEASDVEIADLSAVARERISEPITRASLAEARKVVSDLSAQKRVVPTEPTTEPADGPSAFPTTSTASPSPDAPALQNTPIPLPTDPTTAKDVQ
ncbi:serine/threonine-protein phosphatase [Trueperella pecoris]|uniref:Serine/threonine-protein phosphatase n=1 Tax=Trueperella pecoris TaxID=2733571 RepID=A0A7M1R0Q2_9ACTO|nr:protein phosphatase 2C domain-containing protein [Trueperella pecoris]QOR47758.1 serine/threonine-protein phosphatase [Trueperella pecoris]